MRLSKALRLTWIGTTVAVVGATVLALFIQYRIRIANDWQRYTKLANLKRPGPSDALVVFAPHCDDETLGCGGLIATAKANGTRVKVVIVTNGDGYRIGVARAYGTIRVTPEMCIKYAYQRQSETIHALGKLGIKSNEIIFLGYPDRGISALWTDFWGNDTLYVSKATRSSRSPYVNSFTKGAPYCGESLLEDIKSILLAEKPTIVCSPHPFDDHPDHYATYCFIISAITQLGLQKPKLASRIKVLTYLVHRGDWPVPRGEYVNEPLAPPYALSVGETKWFSFPLSPTIVQAKRAAIRCYKSQTAIEKGFLTSFARRNEIFGVLESQLMPTVKQGTIVVDGSPTDWRGIRPALIDPTGDHLLREISKGGDVRAVYVCKDDDYLYLRVDCARPLSKRILYTTEIRIVPEHNSTVESGNQYNISHAAAPDSAGIRYSVTFKPGSFHNPADAVACSQNNVLEIALPRVALQPKTAVFLRVRTRLAKLPIDRTGWIDVHIPVSAANMTK